MWSRVSVWNWYWVTNSGRDFTCRLCFCSAQVFLYQKVVPIFVTYRKVFIGLQGSKLSGDSFMGFDPVWSCCSRWQLRIMVSTFADSPWVSLGVFWSCRLVLSGSIWFILLILVQFHGTGFGRFYEFWGTALKKLEGCQTRNTVHTF